MRCRFVAIISATRWAALFFVHDRSESSLSDCPRQLRAPVAVRDENSDRILCSCGGLTDPKAAMSDQGSFAETFFAKADARKRGGMHAATMHTNGLSAITNGSACQFANNATRHFLWQNGCACKPRFTFHIAQAPCKLSGDRPSSVGLGWQPRGCRHPRDMLSR